MEVEVASIVKQMMSAGERWESALDAHALAPPDAGFPMRLRVLSIAAGEQAAAFELAAQGGLGWRSRTIDGEFSLAPELTPGRTRPGPPELWERSDAATAALAAALAGSSPKVLAESFTELSEVSGLLATDLQRTYRAATRASRGRGCGPARPRLRGLAALAAPASDPQRGGDRRRRARAP